MRPGIVPNGKDHARACLRVKVPSGQLLNGPAARCQVHFAVIARDGIKKNKSTSYIAPS